MRLIATMRPDETRELETEAVDYVTAKAQLEAQVPAGWSVIVLRQV